MHQTLGVGLAEDLDGAFRGDLPADVAVVLEAKTDGLRMVAVPDHGPAVAGPEVDGGPCAEKRLRLLEQQVGVVALVALGGAPVADRGDAGADLVEVVVHLPVVELVAHAPGDVAPVLEERPHLVAGVEARGRPALTVAVEDGAANGSLQFVRRVRSGEAAFGRPEDEVDLGGLVEAVEPRDHEVGRADGGGQRAEARVGRRRRALPLLLHLRHRAGTPRRCGRRAAAHRRPAAAPRASRAGRGRAGGPLRGGPARPPPPSAHGPCG